MSISQKSNSYNFVDYIAAELSESKTWLIVYYVKHPITKKLIRKRNRVKPLKSITARRKLAKQMIANINERLASGWNPYFEEKNNKQYKLLFDAFEIFINRKNVELKDNNIRFDTYRTYLSRLKVFKEYISLHNSKQLFCFELNRNLINDFLDYIRYDKGNSAKTRDNYLSFCVTLCNFLVEKSYILENPCLKISKTNRKIKTRKIIPADIRDTIFEYLNQKDKNFLTLCLLCYYCLVRRTEISKLKVSSINLQKNILTIEASNSKNRKTQNVTIPDNLKKHLSEHLKGANAKDYLFSSDNLKPGIRKLSPDRITKKWTIMRTTLNISKDIQWYSLKDTGITDLLRAGVPPISVRDQARHYSLKQTDEYTPKDMIENDKNILTNSAKF